MENSIDYDRLEDFWKDRIGSIPNSVLALVLSFAMDDSLDVKEFAKDVALVLKADYGKHNYARFIQTLRDTLDEHR